MYHDIRDLDNSPFLGRYTNKGLIAYLHRQPFIDQIDYIKSHYEVITPATLLQLIMSGEIDRNYAVLTFDDGLRDHYDVTDILVEKQLSGTFFIPVQPVVSRGLMRTHMVQYVIGEMSHKLSVVVDELLTHFSYEIRSYLWNHYSKTAWKDNHWPTERIFITNILRDYPDKLKTMVICESLFKKYVTSDVKSVVNDLYLTQKQIGAMKSAGMTIGGHGYISENLTNYPKHKQEVDLMLTKNFLENLGVTDFYLSYPNGGFNEDTLKLMGDCGFDLGFTTTNQSIENVRGINPFALPRLDAPQKLVI
jgi:peptidoglycan/xylan/chitin deacetylase (PgdA/CDA1 family)